MKSRSIWLTLGLIATIVLATLGGGIAGGAAAWYVAQQQPTASAPTGSTATNVRYQQPGAAADSSISAVNQAGKAVVTVINTLGNSAAAQQNPFGLFGPTSPQVPAQASGSGVIISDKGYIVTNNHVIDGAQKLQVIFADGSRHDATLVGADAFTDLAVIQVKDQVPAVAQLGDSDALEPGQRVYAIGSPLGDFKNSVTEGIVSALHRSISDSNVYREDLIQTDAAINHGNSGGPLIDVNGQVIGINTLVVRSGSAGDQAEGLGFAIPSATVKQVSDKLIQFGKVDRPYLGIQYAQLTPDIAAQLDVQQTSGALIRQVEANGPAAKAGLQQGDIVTAINGDAIDENTTLTDLILKHGVGDKVSLTVQRDGKQLTIEVTLGERPNQAS